MPSPRAIAFSATRILILAYIGLCMTLFVIQRSLIYYPQADSIKPEETLTLPVSGASLAISVRQIVGPRALLYFGGNAEDVSVNLPILSTAFPDRAIYLMHYRGYGASSGKPTETALFADAERLFDEVAKKHSTIDVIGRSLGSGVAIHLASRRPVARLILVTPFDSLESLASRQFPYIPVHWILRDKFESRKYAPLISSTTVILAAGRDEIVPRASTQLLLGRFASGIASLQIIPEATHNDIADSPEFLPILKAALQAAATG